MRFPESFEKLLIEIQKLKPTIADKLLPEQIKTGKISAGYLIEKCGLKGRRIGGAEISSRHANFIVNLAGARAWEVRKLMKICQKEVRKRFNINLEEEIQCVGFN